VRQFLTAALALTLALAGTVGVGMALARLGDEARVTFSYTALL